MKEKFTLKIETTKLTYSPRLMVESGMAWHLYDMVWFKDQDHNSNNRYRVAKCRFLHISDAPGWKEIVENCPSLKIDHDFTIRTHVHINDRDLVWLRIFLGE